MSDLYKLPAGWEWKKLGDKKVCELIMGQSPKSDTYNFEGKGIPFFQGKAEFGDVYPTVSKYCTTPKKIAEAGDILLSVRAPVGPTNIANIQCCIGRGLAAIRPNRKNTITNYMLYFFRNFEIEISKKGKGSTFSAITKKELEEINIPLPPLKEQKRIVAKLDTLFAKIDKAIALHQQNIDETEALMGSVLNEVFGELEGRYGIVKVGTVTDCLVPQRNKPKQFSGDIPWITTDDLTPFKRIKKSTKGMGLSREDILEVKSKIIPKNSVIMSCVGDLGIIAIADTEIVVNQQLHTYQCHENIINDFLMYALYIKRDYMYQIANITTVAYMNKSKCNSIPIPLPPLKIQQKTVQYLDQISAKIEALKKEQQEKMQSLKDLKASILDKAFRGEI